MNLWRSLLLSLTISIISPQYTGHGWSIHPHAILPFLSCSCYHLLPISSSTIQAPPSKFYFLLCISTYLYKSLRSELLKLRGITISSQISCTLKLMFAVRNPLKAMLEGPNAILFPEVIWSLSLTNTIININIIILWLILWVLSLLTVNVWFTWMAKIFYCWTFQVIIRLMIKRIEYYGRSRWGDCWRWTYNNVNIIDPVILRRNCIIISFLV